MAVFTTVRKACWVCGVPSLMAVDSVDYLRWHGGELIQNVWPDWSPAQREQFKTGIHAACWDAMFKEDDDEEA